MRVIFLILIGLSIVINAGAFSRNNGVVSDGTTNLEWQDEYSDNNDSVKETTWQSAIDYCEALTLDGKSDWMLPNVRELFSLFGDTRYNPLVNEIFQNTNSKGYWSSTSILDMTDSVFIAIFSPGPSDAHKNANNSVRCVRVRQ